MDARTSNITIIARSLSYLKTQVELLGSLNLTDINIHAENFYRDLLNKLGNSFENSNYSKQNAASIDLIDEKNKLAIQVTAQNDNVKISESIQGFFQNPKYKNFKLRILLISKDAKEYKTDFTAGGVYNFDPKNDVIDIKRLLSDINNKTIDEISEIANFLNKELLIPKPRTELNEVDTILSLLEYLSDDNNYIEYDKNYECDPDKKINTRFKDYSNLFKNEFKDLHTTYCMTLCEAKKSFGLDTVRAVKISNFLNYISNRFLREANENPQKALDNLTDFFSLKISNNGIKVDLGAIRYYLLNELIGCNIFSEEVECIC